MGQKIRNCFDLPNDERSFQIKKAFQGHAFSFFFFPHNFDRLFKGFGHFCYQLFDNQLTSVVKISMAVSSS